MASLNLFARPCRPVQGIIRAFISAGSAILYFVLGEIETFREKMERPATEGNYPPDGWRKG